MSIKQRKPKYIFILYNYVGVDVFYLPGRSSQKSAFLSIARIMFAEGQINVVGDVIQ